MHPEYFAFKLVPKITNFDDFEAVIPHFKSQNGEFWREARTWDSRLRAKFCKNGSRRIIP